MPNNSTHNQYGNHGHNHGQNSNNQRDSEGRFTDNSTSRSSPGRNDSDTSRNAGSKNPGNFANDRERAAEAGRKGGQNSHGSRSGRDNH